MSEQQLSNEPKFYKGGKSKALRALKGFGEHAVALADKLLFQHGESGEWGFYPLDAEAAQNAGHRKSMEDMNKAVDAANGEESQPEETKVELETMTPAGPTNEDAVSEEPAPATDTQAANVFGATMQQLTHGAQPAPAPAPRAASRTSYTIERNRPEQNGIKRPSAGGLCRAVWDACDDLRTSLNNGDNDGPNFPDSKQIKALASSKGWNTNNAMIEFYQWRRFNGVTGRSAKVVQAEAQQPQNPPEVLPPVLPVPEAQAAA
jgi:hypothetical protein